jgi:hypothetical protein
MLHHRARDLGRLRAGGQRHEAEHRQVDRREILGGLRCGRHVRDDESDDRVHDMARLIVGGLGVLREDRGVALDERVAIGRSRLLGGLIGRSDRFHQCGCPIGARMIGHVDEHADDHRDHERGDTTQPPQPRPRRQSLPREKVPAVTAGILHPERIERHDRHEQRTRVPQREVRAVVAYVVVTIHARAEAVEREEGRRALDRSRRVEHLVCGPAKDDGGAAPCRLGDPIGFFLATAREQPPRAHRRREADEIDGRVIEELAGRRSSATDPTCALEREPGLVVTPCGPQKRDRTGEQLT